MKSPRERRKARKCAILALAEREKICDVGGVGGDGLVSYQNIRAFVSEVYSTSLVDMKYKPADESLMAFANCRQLTQHHSQASSLLKGS